MSAYAHLLGFGTSWDVDRQLVYTDPQTNGGLLVTAEDRAVTEIVQRLVDDGFEDACVIGEVTPYRMTGPRVYFQ